MQTVKKGIGDNSGSILVGAVAMCALLAIAAAGLISLSLNTVLQESDSYDDTSAYLAAESGLLVGTRWFLDRAEDGGELEFAHGGGLTVTVRDSSMDDGQAMIISIASHPFLPYYKRLDWAVGWVANEGGAQEIPSGRFGYFINDPDVAGGIRESGVFNGPVHFNRPIKLFNVSGGGVKPKFNGPVTIYNVPINTIGAQHGIDYAYNRYDPQSKGQRGNNYNAGLMIGGKNDLYPNCGNNCPDQHANLDKIFLNTYSPAGIKYSVAFQQPPAEQAERHILPAPNAGTSLRFGYQANGSACHYCYTYNGQNFNIPQNKQLVIEANSGLTIRDGIIDGVVTVRATGGNNINIDLNNGNLVYRNLAFGGNATNNNYNNVISNNNSVKIDEEIESNHGIGLSRTDILGIYTDNGNINFAKLPNGSGKAGVISAQLFARDGWIYLPDDNYYIRVVGAAATKVYSDPNHGNNQADYQVLFDQRQLSAPGVSFQADNPASSGSGADGDNTRILTGVSRWRETNIPKSGGI
jgi:hypothetical protein